MRDYRALVEQMQYVRGIPQVPGGYYTWRNINNAFYTITTDTVNEQHHPARGADGQGVLHQRLNQLQAHGIRSAAPSDGRHDEGGVR
jgi:hypothetical protein